MCRLLGAEGLTTLLAAILPECKVIIHSSDISNLAIVAETMVGAQIRHSDSAHPVFLDLYQRLDAPEAK